MQIRIFTLTDQWTLDKDVQITYTFPNPQCDGLTFHDVENNTITEFSSSVLLH